MKHLHLALALCLGALIGQSQDRHEIQFRAGYGVAGYKTNLNVSYEQAGIKLEYDTTDGAATAHFPLELRYEVSSRLNLGLDARFGKYLYAKDDNNGSKSNKFNFIGLGAEAILYEAGNARIYLGAGFHNARLTTIEEKGNVLLPYKETANWKGAGYRLNLGIMGFFGESPFGINGNIGYNHLKLNLESINQDGNNLDLTNFKGTYTLGGIELMLGIVFRLNVGE
jgi:hypothetical protein